MLPGFPLVVPGDTAAPPAPTTTGKAVAVTVTLFAGVPCPHKGLALYGVTGLFTSLNPPAPPPP